MNMSIRKWIAGLEISNLDIGMLVVVVATLVNGALGLYLVRIGKRERSLVLVAVTASFACGGEPPPPAKPEKVYGGLRPASTPVRS